MRLKTVTCICPIREQEHSENHRYARFVTQINVGTSPVSVGSNQALNSLGALVYLVQGIRAGTPFTCLTANALLATAGRECLGHANYDAQVRKQFLLPYFKLNMNRFYHQCEFLFYYSKIVARCVPFYKNRPCA